MFLGNITALPEYANAKQTDCRLLRRIRVYFAVIRLGTRRCQSRGEMEMEVFIDEKRRSAQCRPGEGETEGRVVCANSGFG